MKRGGSLQLTIFTALVCISFLNLCISCGAQFGKRQIIAGRGWHPTCPNFLHCPSVEREMVMRIFFRRNEKDFKQVCLFVSYDILLHLIEKDFAHSIIDSLFDFIDGDVRNKKTCLFRQTDPVWLR